MRKIGFFFGGGLLWLLAVIFYQSKYDQNLECPGVMLAALLGVVFVCAVSLAGLVVLVCKLFRKGRAESRGR